LGALLAGPAAAQNAAAMRALHAALNSQLSRNDFGRPLHVESKEASGEHAGEVYATLDRPYGKVMRALRSTDQWCDILILPANVKYCRPSSASAAETLTVFVGRKAEDALESAYRVDFRYELAAAGEDYLRVALGSASGPFGTTNYRIGVEAAPLDDRRTFIHMSYSYTLGIAARLAMQAYLATAGRDKVGFSIVDRLADGRPVHVGGARGVLERNAMRYYLALEAHLGALDAPPPERPESRVRSWYALIERYPLQLQEDLPRDEYVRIKLSQVQRQQDGAASGATR
jgi:hypothetical protein